MARAPCAAHKIFVGRKTLLPARARRPAEVGHITCEYYLLTQQRGDIRTVKGVGIGGGEDMTRT